MAIALQRDRRIVAVGWASGGVNDRFDDNWALARYRANGRLDPSFADDGRLRMAFGGGFGDGAFDVAVQPNDRIVVAGSVVVRLRRQGNLDHSFAGNGIARPPEPLRPRAVVLQPDKKVLIAGNTRSGLALARYRPNGSLDQSFGGAGADLDHGERGGVVITDLGGQPYRTDVSDLALQSDGKLVVVGTADTDDEGYGKLLVVRYNPDGGLDPTFSDDGKVTLDAFALGLGVALQRDGKILLAGDSGANFAVARLLADGSLDTSFAEDGWASYFIGTARDVVQLQDGRILAAGDSGEFALASLTPSGELDQTFSGNGVAKTTFFGDYDEAHELAIQPNGKVVLAGSATLAKPPHDERFALARFKAP